MSPTPSDSHFQLRTLLTTRAPATLLRADVPGLVRAAQQQGVAPYLYWRLNALRVPLDAPEWEPLRATYRAQVTRHRTFCDAAEKIDAALQRANIPSIWLKGLALAHSVYPDPALRPMRDLDVLVPFKQRRAALEAMRQLGYALDIVRPSETLQDMSHDYHLRGAIPLELHYRLLGVHSKFFTPGDLAWFWTQTRSFPLGTRALAMLAPEAQVLHLCAHAILNHSEAEFLLSRFLDLHLVITAAPQLDWDLVRERARAFRWTYAVERALEITRTYFGTPIPETVIQGLMTQRPLDEDNARALHNQPEANTLENVRNYMRGMTVREQWTWVKDSVLPSREYMQWRYHPKTRRQLILAYPYRWFDIARHAVGAAFRHK
jgi:hypothetical protein